MTNANTFGFVDSMKKQGEYGRKLNPFRDMFYIASRILKRLRPAAIKNTSIHPTAKIEPGSQVVECEVGRHSYCGYDCTLLNATIGNFCSIADGVVIGGSNHPMHFVSTSPVFLSHRDSVKTKLANFEYLDLPKTLVGNDVWLGRSAHIRAGVTVGSGAVVAMGSVVTRDVEPYAIVGGNPAKVIRMRFPQDVIDGLQATAWWNLSDEELRDWAHLFNDPENFLKAWAKD